jgi:hypothetical protein
LLTSRFVRMYVESITVEFVKLVCAVSSSLCLSELLYSVMGIIYVCCAVETHRDFKNFVG